MHVQYVMRKWLYIFYGLSYKSRYIHSTTSQIAEFWYCLKQQKPKIRQWTHSRPVFFHWNINCHLFMRVQERIITPFMFSLSCFSSSSSFLGIIHRYWIAHHIRASHTHWAEVICWNPNEQKYKRFFLS